MTDNIPTNDRQAGHEAWCNRQGKYVTITRDFSDMADDYYLILLCDIAIFGEVPEIVSVVELSSQTQQAFTD